MGEFEAVDEAGLLVQAAEVAGEIDDGVLFLEGFIGQGVIEVIESLFDLVSVLIAISYCVLRYCAMFRISRISL